jgi:hypothetical protein
MKEQRKVDKFVQSNEHRERLVRRLSDQIGPALALGQDDTHRAQALLAGLSASHRQALAEVRGGGKTRADAKRDLDSATAAIETSLKALLGDRGMLALRDLRRKEDQALRAESAPPAQK